MSAPTFSTSAWRLPPKNKTGEKRAGRFDRDAYAKLGLAEVVEKVEGRKDAPPPARITGSPAPAKGDGDLPTMDTSSWTLTERKPPKPKVHRPKSELGKKWDDDPPKDRRGRPMLYGGDDDENEDTGRTAVKMAGLGADRIAEMRKLAGLVEDKEIHFQLGSIHRRMPDERRAVPRELAEGMPKAGAMLTHRGGHPERTERHKVVRVYPTKGDADGPLPRSLLRLIRKGGGAALTDLQDHKKLGRPQYFVMYLDASGKIDGAPVHLKPHQYKRAMSYHYEGTLGTLDRLPPDIRRLVEGRSTLPHGGFRPVTTTNSGILDPVTEGVDHGESYIDRVLAESRWFLKDFREGPSVSRGSYSGSDPSYSDVELDLDDEDEKKKKKQKQLKQPKRAAPPDDDEEPEDDDEEEMGEARRVRYHHVGPGGRGRAVAQHKQSPKQHRYNVSSSTRLSKKHWEISRGGRASRRKSARIAKTLHRSAAESTENWDQHAEGIGKHIAALGSKIKGGTERSRKGVEKAKEKVHGFLKKHGFHGADDDKPKRKKAPARKKRLPKKGPPSAAK